MKMIEDGEISGKHLIKFVGLLTKDWVTANYFDRCFSALENAAEKFTPLDALEVSNMCLK